MQEIRALTSLRGLAALYVSLLHFSTAAERHCVTTIPALAPRGHLAVDFFFVLSGFIMAYTYTQEFERLGYLRALPSFLVKRGARLLPLHWFVTLLLLLYTLWVAPGFDVGPEPAFHTLHPVRDVALNLLLLQGIGFAPNMNGPSWSISVEMFAYFTFPFFLLLSASKHTIVRWASLALALLILVLTALQNHELSLNTVETSVGWTIARGFTEFFLGMITYRVFAQGKGVTWISKDVFTLFFFVIAAAMMVIRLWDLVAVLAFPIIILGVAHNRGRVTTILEQRFFYFLGTISFSLYLIHYPIAYLELQLLTHLHQELLSKAAALLIAVVGAFSIIPLAWVTFVLIERPGRSAIRAIGEQLKPRS